MDYLRQMFSKCGTSDQFLERIYRKLVHFLKLFLHETCLGRSQHQINDQIEVIIQNLGVKHGQEKNAFLGNLDQIHAHTLLIHKQCFDPFSASFDELQHFGQNQIQIRKETGLVARINLPQKVDDLDRLRVNNLMNHLENGFGKFEHGLWN